jgi:enamine deaminase RidA (YjgF/YER057c/UK114 family)
MDPDQVSPIRLNGCMDGHSNRRGAGQDVADCNRRYEREPWMARKDVIIPSGWEELYERSHYAPAVRDGDCLWCSGIIGVSRDGGVSPDPRTHFRHAFLLVEKLLAAAGASFADVIDLTTFHVNLRDHWQDFLAVKDEFIAAPYPAWTAIGVTELAISGALLEIKVIARIPTVKDARRAPGTD